MYEALLSMCGLPSTEPNSLQNSRTAGTYISKLYTSHLAYPSPVHGRWIERFFGRPTATSSPCPLLHLGHWSATRSARRRVAAFNQINQSSLCHSLASLPTYVSQCCRALRYAPVFQRLRVTMPISHQQN
jgi:hypothetical protein